MKKIIFMPFINDAGGAAWREKIKNDFLTGCTALTKEINDIRKNKNNRDVYPNDQAYYDALHEKKLIRQQMWISRLITETACVFDEYLMKLSGDDLDSEKTTVVCALPEFFWCDINDNDKHPEIENYHKPLYLDTARDLLTEYNALESFVPNALMELTNKYNNLIIFAGTAMWKQINHEDHKKEEIFNSLIVYADGEYKESITKHNVSTIDGFYTFDAYGEAYLAKGKIGESTFNAAPITEFNGMRFTYDICLDFICGNVGGRDAPLSTELCGNEAVDVNVLIAAGMPVSIPERSEYVREMKSDLLLRCDGLCLPRGEIVKRDNSLAAKLIEVKK